MGSVTGEASCGVDSTRPLEIGGLSFDFDLVRRRTVQIVDGVIGSSRRWAAKHSTVGAPPGHHVGGCDRQADRANGGVELLELLRILSGMTMLMAEIHPAHCRGDQ